MPAVKAPSIVLVTGWVLCSYGSVRNYLTTDAHHIGASGFVAVWVCKILLESGYTVRGTVRSTSKGEYLVKQLKSDRFSHVIVEDIAKDGAFDEAVKGVDAVAHTASPFHFQADDPQSLIEPAVKGTVGVLKSIEKNAPSVQRVVVTSSAAAIVDTSKPTGTVFTENDWNTFSTKEVEEKGRDAAGGDKYRASKTLAEQAAWAGVEAKKPKWDLATINPPMVLGPILQQIDNPANLNTSVAMLYKITHAKEGETPREVLLQPNMYGYSYRLEVLFAKNLVLIFLYRSFVDVRDVALAHVRALEVPEAGGQRFITSGGTLCWQDALDVLPRPYPRGIPGAGKSLLHNTFDASKARKVLGINFKGLEETVKDTELGLSERGWGIA
ncbi:methylglyoxal reductase (NADPH-dependent) gre2 [Ceratobasidium sp. 428]|nr:methylglyoxal reductase (NADPH-dependent) gre2 [Ceratobasidium sp. 428]